MPNKNLQNLSPTHFGIKLFCVATDTDDGRRRRTTDDGDRRRRRTTTTDDGRRTTGTAADTHGGRGRRVQTTHAAGGRSGAKRCLTQASSQLALPLSRSEFRSAAPAGIMGGWGARALTQVSIQRLGTGRTDRASLLLTFHTLSLLLTTVTVRVLVIPVSGLLRPTVVGPLVLAISIVRRWPSSCLSLPIAR
jgi:hypothetical protein